MACDFFSVDTVLLSRLYVLVFIHLDTRLVRIAGVTAKPVTDWVTQRARNLSTELTEQARPVEFLVRDRDTKFTASFGAVLLATGDDPGVRGDQQRSYEVTDEQRYRAKTPRLAVTRPNNSSRAHTRTQRDVGQRAQTRHGRLSLGSASDGAE
jgi:hypothetical protein